MKITGNDRIPHFVYFEDFNDGLAQDWAPAAGTWAVENNQYRNSTSNGIENCIYTGSTFADYTFSAKIKPDWDNNAGLIFNYTDADNYYLIELDANPKTATLKRVKNGSESTLAKANYTGGGAGNYVTVEIKNDGKLTTVKINSVTVFNAVSTSDFSFGKIGLYTWWQPVWFDDVDVKAKGTVTSVQQKVNIVSASVDVFPNPVTQGCLNVNISSTGGGQVQIYMYNMSGKLVLEQESGERNITVSTEKLQSPGVYLLKIITPNNSFQQKIVLL